MILLEQSRFVFVIFKQLTFRRAGSTGKILTELALKKNYLVVAAVRRPDAIKFQHERLQVLKADLTDHISIQNVVRGAGKRSFKNFASVWPFNS